MAVLLRVLVLGVIAVAADDANITWKSGSHTTLPCVIPDRGQVRMRRPPPPLDDEPRRSSPYAWTHDGDHIENPLLSNGSFVVDNSHGTEGVYQCGVKSQGGTILGYPIHLKFTTFKEDTLQSPKNVVTRSGQPVLMDCSVESGPLATITWMQSYTDIREDDRHFLLGNQLLITNVQKEDEGSYRCTLTNEALNKIVTSLPGYLNLEESSEVPETAVLEPSFLKVKHDGNIIAAKGSRVVLPCPVIGWPRPEVIWELTPPESRRSELEFTGEVLVLPHLEVDQEGTYTCSVVGGNLRKTFNVTIAEPPTIITPPAYKETLRASTVRFNCSASGKPAPSITWFKDGTPLVFGGRINLRLSTDAKRHELVISGVTTSDAGVYQCFAKNVLQTVSAWAILNITGLSADAPEEVKCWPQGHDLVRLTWKPPVAAVVVAYTVHAIQDSMQGSTIPGAPRQSTEQMMSLPLSLTPYRFQIRAYLQPTLKNKNVASDMSEAVVCQGQGVPIQLANVNDTEVTVSWKNFATQHPGVVQWILQYKDENEEHNVTLGSDVLNYTLKATPSTPLKVRVLGTRSIPWLQQNLEHVPWMSTNNAGGIDDGEESAVPQYLEVSEVSTRSFTINWRIDSPVKYVFSVCLKKVNDKEEECKESQETSATFEDLQPNTDYEIWVQARAVGRSTGGGQSAPYVVTTLSEGAYHFRNLSGQFINATTLNVTWSGPPSLYTVLYSSQLKLPVEQWKSVQTEGNTVLISGLNPTNRTYLIVKNNDSQDWSKVETIPPLYKDLASYFFQNLTSQFVNSSTLKVSWNGPPSQYTVLYSSQLNLPVEQWNAVQTDDNIVLIPGIDPIETTYVTVKEMKSQAHSKIETIQPSTDLDTKELHYSYTNRGVRVWWESEAGGAGGAGGARVCAAQLLTRPVEQWDCRSATTNVELTDLDPSLPTYVMVTLSNKHKSQVLTIEPRPKDYSAVYLGVGITCGILVLCLVTVTTIYLWRKRKHGRLLLRSRRRNPTPNDGNEEGGSEMKNVGGRLANGSKDAGQPLLNGHVHITENPTSRTPNGKMKNRLLEAAFDLSRYNDSDVTQETVLDPDTSATGFNPLDTSRKPEFELSRSSRDSTNNSFNKLPDDNMNSEINRSSFNLDNSKIQPTLQPNG